ncbi:MAG: hypothetical protein DWH74_00040 [Planctomycetota bacterium]|nr:MAG: hypothetical protein DWH74_00040 [Planctomycetota bacterium]
MIRLNVGLSRKIGQANYGSKGGSVHLEVEVADLDHTKLRESIHKLFTLAKQSLEDELGNDGVDVQDKPVVQISAQPTGQTLEQAITAQGRQATAKQLSFLQNLARTQRRNLEKECMEEFETYPERLTSKQASTMIEKWRNSLVSAR